MYNQTFCQISLSNSIWKVRFLFLLCLSCISLELCCSLISLSFLFFKLFCLTQTPSLPPSLPLCSESQKAEMWKFRCNVMHDCWEMNRESLSPPIKERGERLHSSHFHYSSKRTQYFSRKLSKPLQLIFLHFLPIYYTSKLVMAFLPRAFLLLLLAVVCIQLSGGKTLMTL